MGSASHCRANQRDAELGDGVQEMVSGIQDPHLLWQPERKEAEENGMLLYLITSSVI